MGAASKWLLRWLLWCFLWSLAWLYQIAPRSPPPVPDQQPLGLTLTQILHLPQLQITLVLLVGLHVILHVLLPHWRGSPFAAKPVIVAHLCPFLLNFVAMAVYGTGLWLTDPDLAEPGFDRTWGAHAGVQQLTVAMLAVQIYDVPTSLLIRELREQGWEFIAHHIAVLLLCLVSLRYRAFSYYGSYFMGVIECSSPFLALVDLFREFPELAERYPALNSLSRIAFAVVFFAVRIVGWVSPSLSFWGDALPLYEDGAVLHGLPLSCLTGWLVAHLGLTLLQCYWGCLILKEAIIMLAGPRAAEKPRKVAHMTTQQLLAALGEVGVGPECCKDASKTELEALLKQETGEAWFKKVN